jgi:hypothetical protein
LKAPAVLNGIPYSLRIVLLIVLLSKALVFCLGYAVTYVTLGPASPLSILNTQFYHWDSLYYVDIAKNWYSNQGASQNLIVFFPLYPLLIRLTTVNFSSINLSALFVSNASSVFAAVYMFKLVKLDYDDNAAVKAVLYLCVFPTAFFLSLVYTEGLFLALTIASFYYARRGNWFIAGFLSFFSALTRIGGLVLLPALLVEYLHQRNWKLRSINKNVLWIFLSFVGFIVYLNINNQVTGNLFTFVEVERVHWHQSINPLQGFQQALQSSSTGPFPINVQAAAQLIFAGLGLTAIWAGFKFRLRPSLNAYMLLTWLLAVSTSYWNSIPRYVLTIFPMFILMGFLSRSKRTDYLLATLSLVVMSIFTLVFAMGKFVF